MKSNDPQQNPSGHDTPTEPPLRALELSYRRLFEEVASPGESPAHGEKIPSGDETILLVEDTLWLRQLLQRILHACGYTVLEAAHGEEAIRLAETHPGTIHLLMADLGLPGISGRQLAWRVSALKPGIKLLYVSGYTAEAVLRHGALEPETAFLQKPFTPGTLARKVREVLASA